MSMREQRDVTLDSTRPGDDPIGSRSDLLRRFTTRAPIPEDEPARRLSVDLLGRQALVLAVVPLDEVGLDDRTGRDAGQLTGFARPLQRADEHERKRSAAQGGPQEFREPAPVVGQRNVRRAGVPAVQAPLGLAVPDREHAHGNHSVTVITLSVLAGSNLISLASAMALPAASPKLIAQNEGDND